MEPGISMKHFLSNLLLMFILALLAGCATSRVPADYRAGVVVESLSASVSISVSTSQQGMSGHGYLLYRRPDKVHLVVLSPFGTTLMEVFGNGDRVTLVYPSKQTAFTGRFDELPEGTGLQGWRLMRWVMDADPVPGIADGTIERTGAGGENEKITLKNGLITAKVSAAGDKAYYERYTVIDGVPLAVQIDLRTPLDERIRLALDEPEVNRPLEDDLFTPRLEGMSLLPLSALQAVR